MTPLVILGGAHENVALLLDTVTMGTLTSSGTMKKTGEYFNALNDTQ